MRNYFLFLLLALLVGCATKLSEDDLQTAALMPEPVALSILAKYKIPDSFIWNPAGLICSKEWLNVRETSSVIFNSSENRLGWQFIHDLDDC